MWESHAAPGGEVRALLGQHGAPVYRAFPGMEARPNPGKPTHHTTSLFDQRMGRAGLTALPGWQGRGSQPCPQPAEAGPWISPRGLLQASVHPAALTRRARRRKQHLDPPSCVGLPTAPQHEQAALRMNLAGLTGDHQPGGSVCPTHATPLTPLPWEAESPRLSLLPDTHPSKPWSASPASRLHTGARGGGSRLTWTLDSVCGHYQTPGLWKGQPAPSSSPGPSLRTTPTGCELNSLLSCLGAFRENNHLQTTSPPHPTKKPWQLGRGLNRQESSGAHSTHATL